MLTEASVIAGASAYFKDKQSPLEDLLRKIMPSQNLTDTPLAHAKYSEICETLIDGLVDASNLPGFVSVGFLVKALSYSWQYLYFSWFILASECSICLQPHIRLRCLAATLPRRSLT